MACVLCCQARFNEMSGKDLGEYLMDHIAPTLIGPDGFYITDKHHTSLAVLLSNQDDSDKLILANITHNWYAQTCLPWQQSSLTL